MNTILCDKCGSTIPLRTIVAGVDPQPTGHYACKICDPPKKAQGKKGGCGILVHILAIALFAFCGIGLQKCSFTKVAEIRQLARVPNTEVLAAVPGEIHLTGNAVGAKIPEPNLNAPDTSLPCFYYRYHVERKERTSNNKTKWVTITDQKKFVSRFHLRDKTGEIAIIPNARVDFNVPQSNQRRDGNRRYTEYRLDPGDTVLIYGYAQQDPLAGIGEIAADTLSVSFDQVGDYQPLISEKTELKERTGRATTSIFACWAGLCLIGAATAFVFSLTGKHHLLTYFWILSTVVGAVLVFLGIAMMRSDLRAAHEHVVRQEQTVQTVIAEAFEKQGVHWDRTWTSLGDLTAKLSLTDTETQRLRRVRIDLAAASRRVTDQTKKFPYNLFASSVNLKMLPDIPLPPEDEEQLSQLESKFQKAKLSGFATWLWGSVGLVTAILATIFGFRSVRQKRMTENLETSSTKGVAYGLTELKGIIDLPEGIDPLKSPLARRPCVTYDYRIHEKRGHGKNAKWVEIHHEGRRTLFVCRDRDGTFPINPSGAKLMTWRKDKKKEGKLRHTETRLQFGDPIYAIGAATIDPDTGDSLHLCKPEIKSEPFILASFTEEAVAAKSGIRAIAWLTGAFGAILLAGLMLFASGGAFSPADYLAAAFVGPAYLAALTLILHYNDLVFLRQRARRNWANIEISLKKRHDLMPTMIETAKAFMGHESDVHTRLTNLRQSYGGDAALSPDIAETLLQEGRILGGAIMGHIEAHPELQASKQTSLLMRQFIALEDEISLMREGYNNAVTQYNTRITIFPDVFLAKLGRFLPMDTLDYQSEVIPMPELAQETWRREQAATQPLTLPQNDNWTTTPLPVPNPDAPIIDALDERAYIYASLLDETGEMRTTQLEILTEQEGHEITAAITSQIDQVQQLDPWTRYNQARKLMPQLRNMTAESFLHFKAVARLLIEADDRISTYEYAFEKALSFLVEPVFTAFIPPSIRHTSIDTLTKEIQILHTHLSTPEEETNLGTFDAALAEILHSTPEVRQQIYSQSHQTYISSGGTPNTTRYLLIQSLADTLHLKI
jgi:hypothetical protein